MGTFLAGLEDAKLVRTLAFAEFQEAADFVIPRNEILVLDGDVGVGKRVLAADFLSRQALPTTTFTLPPTQSSKDIVRWLHKAICTGDEAEALSERDIQDDLIEALSVQRILLVQNVERMGKEAAGQLEWLHSHPRANWTLVLVGNPGTATAVERDAHLRGGVASTVTVGPLKGRELLSALQSMHPLFLGASTDLLVEMDSRVCHGIIGHWARVLQVAVYLQKAAVANGKEAPVLDRAFAKAVIHRLPGTMTRKRG